MNGKFDRDREITEANGFKLNSNKKSIREQHPFDDEGLGVPGLLVWNKCVERRQIGKGEEEEMEVQEEEENEEDGG
ncbi:hypothetical protein HZH66_014905 [Vespula vulgaris]|uniref:Uncharacterized protein n=1 Tax=Vespula vulgaris TaxID=7454 RepID=A0A834MQ23_VESVU|nr:hypothetical protein HZH66_014905 [Vespula vulgaris]